jgi:hypothetical protein
MIEAGGDYTLFDSNRSAIGLATNTTLDLKSPAYAWVDQGGSMPSRSNK